MNIKVCVCTCICMDKYVKLFQIFVFIIIMIIVVIIFFSFGILLVLFVLTFAVYPRYSLVLLKPKTHFSFVSSCIEKIYMYVKFQQFLMTSGLKIKGNIIIHIFFIMQHMHLKLSPLVQLYDRMQNNSL